MLDGGEDAPDGAVVAAADASGQGIYVPSAQPIRGRRESSEVDPTGASVVSGASAEEKALEAMRRAERSIATGGPVDWRQHYAELAGATLLMLRKRHAQRPLRDHRAPT